MPWRRASCRGPAPITWSRPASRRPAVNPRSPCPAAARSPTHQMSRPSGRCGIVGIRWPTDSSTRWVADSSSAIWQPEFAAPTTSTRPGGTVLRTPVVARCGSGARPGRAASAIGGMKGIWNGPVATTTCPASIGLVAGLRDVPAVAPWSATSRSCSAAPAARTLRRRSAGSRRRRPCPGRCPARRGRAGPAGCRTGPR